MLATRALLSGSKVTTRFSWATSWDKTTVVIDYQSYQKGHFIMTWQLPQEGEVEPTELSSSRPASCGKCSPIIDPSGAGQYDKGVWVPRSMQSRGLRNQT